MLLTHRTNHEFLESILRDGKLQSRAQREKSLPSWVGEESKFVFFSVSAPGTPLATALNGNVVLVFSMDALLAAYPKFVMNSGNNFGPTNGRPNNTGNCRCRWTYSTLGNNPRGPCVKGSVQEMLDVFQANNLYSLDKCDGGPEVAIPDEVILLPHLLAIRIDAAYKSTLDSKIPEEYKHLVEYVPRAGGRRKSKKRTRNTRKLKKRK